jgi:hypothetical protein
MDGIVNQTTKIYIFFFDIVHTILSYCNILITIAHCFACSVLYD